MSEFAHIMQPMSTDYNCTASPGELARLIIGDTVLQLGSDGISRQRLVNEKQSVWMVDKFRFQEFKKITHLNEVTITISHRHEKGVRVYYSAQVICSKTLMARAEICFFAVEYESRRIIRLKELEPLWNCPALPGKNMEKAYFQGEMRHKKTEHIRFSDCDLNRHLSSPKYLDFVCDVTEYWPERVKLCELIQVDYVSECRPESELVLYAARHGDAQYVRGTHADGTTAFDAVCKYRDSEC